MAIGARDFVIGMAAGVPRHPGVRFMAVDTEIVLYDDGRQSIRSEVDGRRTLLSASHAPGMVAAGAVARFTLQLSVTEWTARIARYRMFGPKYGERYLVVVTRETGISTFTTVAWCLLVGRLRSDGTWQTDGGEEH